MDLKISADDVIDKKSLRKETIDTQDEIRSTPVPPVRQSNHERAQFAAMDDLGLEDGDDALQYALMLSMDGDTSEYGDLVPASGAEFDAGEGGGDGEDAELQEMLEMIRIAEERERVGQGSSA